MKGRPHFLNVLLSGFDSFVDAAIENNFFTPLYLSHSIYFQLRALKWSSVHQKGL